MSLGSARSPHSTSTTPSSSVAEAAVAAQLAGAREQRRADHDGMARARRRTRRAPPGPGVARTRATTAEVMNGWSASTITTSSAAPSDGEAVAQRRAHPLRPAREHGHLGAAQVGAGADLLGARPEHHHGAADGPHGGQGVLDQRAAAHLRELLGAAAEAAPLAGGEHDRRAHASCPSIRSASSSKDAMLFPGSSRSKCGMAACMPRVSGS